MLTTSSDARDRSELQGVQPPKKPSKRRQLQPGALMRNYGIAVFLLLMIAVFSILMPTTFASGGNFRQILADQAVPGILALAVILPLTAGEFDLSVGANLGICTISGIVLAGTGLPLPLVLAATIALGVLVGAVNAYMTIVVGVNAFIATLGMATILSGINLLLTNSTLITHTSEAFGALTNTRIPGGVQVVVFYFLAAALALWFILERTPYGRYLRATGMGRDAAELSGVRTRGYLASAFIGAGLLAGIGGTLQASRAGSATPDLGPEFLLPAYAAAFLGATAIRAGFFNVWGTVLGVYLLAVGANGLDILGAKTWVTHVFNGVALLVAVSAATLVQRRKAKSRAS
ncbi:sugar ABC transporter permease [Zafaria cholistanensis]|uniref:Sugar ABC transporter permease n=1 Tax=Zafaria cholistanensis TaxID=1682741 RepID=A0A5A7NVC0_9MICC|nr:ABC transporter permease [Zafaria cholistanensis]GER23991.1 sugar ABC transporter permease [Zafaria cholistanensis]